MTWEIFEEEMVNQLLNVCDEREAQNIYSYLVQEFAGQSLIIAKLSELSEDTVSQIKTLVSKVVAGDSLQVALGFSYFLDLKLAINKSVLAPRPETEEMVLWISEHINPKDRLLDIGTGSGCMPIYLKHRFPSTEVYATDVSKEALEIAMENAKANKVDVHFQQHNVLTDKAWPEQLNHVISNPPYIPEQERASMGEVVLENDPDLALFVPDDDPLLFYREIATKAKDYLVDGGYLWFELHEDYANQTAELVENLGYKNVVVKEDLQQKLRMLSARKA